MKQKTTEPRSASVNDAPAPPRNYSGVSDAPNVKPVKPWMRTREGRDTGDYDAVAKPSGQ